MKVLFVTGDDYAALTAEEYGIERIIDNLKNEVDNDKFDALILEFNEVDSRFIDFIKNRVLDYDQSKTTKCPVCGGNVKIISQEYKSNKVDIKTGESIIVPDVKIYECLNSECQHTWLPHEEEKRIDNVIKNREVKK